MFEISFKNGPHIDRFTKLYKLHFIWMPLFVAIYNQKFRGVRTRIRNLQMSESVLFPVSLMSKTPKPTGFSLKRSNYPA
jgi:hypothetical protein